jgi:phosphoadenosine phosphosulfate reductase
MRDLFGDKVERAIELLRMYQPKDQPYYGCFSGGKDSCVIKEIAKMGGINVIWHYNVTTIDPPELCRFIKKFHPDVIWEKPKVPFFKEAIKRGFPTRTARWCCETYKEGVSPVGSTLIMGVRAAESPRRAKAWKEVTAHIKTGQYAIAPIIDWMDEEVWQFLLENSVTFCTLYYHGFKRLGCIGCPMSSNRKREFAVWPHFERAWRNLFNEIWNLRSGSLQRDGKIWMGNKFWNSPDEMFEWWISNDPLPKDNECQGILDMYS